jgi:glycosyltransferase involved in cell wall biosynthesis
MAIGLPVIASNFPLYRDIVEGSGCGVCVNPEDPREVADAIKMLMENPALAEEMGVKGKQAVFERYRWDVEASKLAKFYERVFRARPRGRATNEQA